MRYVLFIYIAVFGLGCILMIAAEFFSPSEERDPLGETMFDLLWAGVLFAGMLFLALGVSNPLLRLIWMFTAPGVVAIQLLLSWRARSREKKSLTHTEASSSLRFPDIGTLLLSLPALAFNLYFAFGAQSPQ